MPDSESEIVALRKSIERLTAEVTRLANVLQSTARATDSESQAQIREMMDRPDVGWEDRNTPSDDPEDGNDTARV